MVETTTTSDSSVVMGAMRSVCSATSAAAMVIVVNKGWNPTLRRTTSYWAAAMSRSAKAPLESVNTARDIIAMLTSTPATG